MVTVQALLVSGTQLQHAFSSQLEEEEEKVAEAAVEMEQRANGRRVRSRVVHLLWTNPKLG